MDPRPAPPPLHCLGEEKKERIPKIDIKPNREEGGGGGGVVRGDSGRNDISAQEPFSWFLGKERGSFQYTGPGDSVQYCNLTQEVATK